MFIFAFVMNKKYEFGILILFLLSTLNLSAEKLIKIDKGYSRTSINTAVFRKNSVVSSGNFQYAAYYDKDCFLTLARRRLKSEVWEIKRSEYKGNCRDAHNIISIMADGDGYLHVSFDHHGNKLKYCKTIAPGSLQLGPLKIMTGKDENNVTYPEFYYLKGGNLLFVYRSGSSGRGNLVMNRYDVKKKEWSRVQNILIDGENKRNAYWQMCVDKKGTIHVSWVWRETPDVATNHDLCYACSKDGGKTWQKSDGTKYKLPVNAANAEYIYRIPQNSELINQTSMTADNYGNPYIATYWKENNDVSPQYRIVYYDEGKWKSEKVGNRKKGFSLSGTGTKMIPIARPCLAVKNKGHKTEAFFFFRDKERNSRVSLAYTEDIRSGNWEISDLTDFSVNAWEPTYDTELWKNKGVLDLFVQNTAQGDGEKEKETEPQDVYILEVKK